MATVEQFRLLFEREHPFVYRFVYALVGDAELAKELTQETFVRAFEAFGRYEERSAVSTWLCGIARNVVRNDWRARRQSLRVFDADAVADGIESEGAEERAMSGQLRDAIRRALLRLDEEKRVAFTLKVLEGRSYEEIEAVTGSAIAKLKTDVHRARLQLREALRGFVEER
ncbi:MAG: RNA polymerase sigma factor [Acidobacteriota bacterium]|nr:RNA polymerase sigma factor [Acidobacteriota bacterium]